MTSLPESTIIEITLIGTGGGYGESVVIHLGNESWVVVDSCINPNSKICLPLEYLKSIGVDVSKDVKLIICTHWHDDHILGISQLLDESISAKFCMARPLDKKKFLRLVGLDYQKAKNDSNTSSTIELNNCIKIMQDRKFEFQNAIQDRILFTANLNNISSQIIALSPSDFVVNEYDKEISELITEYGYSNRKIVCQTPNDKSVALLLKVNNQRIILGSDLEVSEDNRKGWLCILNESQSIDSKSSLFKIPHHGSKNGYHERIWDELLIDNVVANLTPWNRNTKLPKKEMLLKYKKHTDELYMTASLNNNKPKERERSISKAISRFNGTLREIKYKLGIIRCRIGVDQNNEPWQIKLIGSAHKIEDNILNK
jgi:beta-lactamase superfamily II metal-dependent hydrolase